MQVNENFSFFYQYTYPINSFTRNCILVIWSILYDHISSFQIISNHWDPVVTCVIWIRAAQVEGNIGEQDGTIAIVTFHLGRQLRMKRVVNWNSSDTLQEMVRKCILVINESALLSQAL